MALTHQKKKVFFAIPILILIGSLYFRDHNTPKADWHNSELFSPIVPVLLKPSQRLKKVSQPSESKDTTELLKILYEVFQSKNDNDPRLDQYFQNLSQESKAALMETYQTLPSESRNEKGTIVFLLGKNMDSPQDLEFLGQVLLETPCRALSDCNQVQTSNERDETGATQITLEYPQIVALKALQHYLYQYPHSPQALQILHQAAHSKSPLERELASAYIQQNPPLSN